MVKGRIGVLFLSLLLAFIFPGCSRKTIIPNTGQPPVNEQRLIAKAEKLAAEGRFPSANFYLGKATELALKAQNWEKLIHCYVLIGNNFQKMGDSRQAIENLSQALNLAYSHQGYDSLELAKSATRIANRYFLQKNFNEAIALYNQALGMLLKILGPEHPEVAKCYNSLALVYWNSGDSQKASECYNKSLSIKLKGFQNINTGVIRNYRFLDGMRVAPDLLGEAHQFFNRSLGIYLETYGSQHPHVAAIYENIGIVYTLEGHYDQALANLQKSLTIKMDTYGEESPEVATGFENIGICLRLKGNDAEAIKFLNYALEIKEAQKEKIRSDIASTYFQLGKVFAQQNQFDSALSYFQQALQAMIPGLAATGLEVNPTLPQPCSKNHLLEILLAKAETLAQKYTHAPTRLNDLKLSFETFKLIIDLIDHLRLDYKSEEYRLLFAARYQQVYDQALQTAGQLYEASKDQRYLEAAFTISEKSKAALLGEALVEVDAKRFSGIPAELLEKEQELKKKLVLYDIYLEKEQQKENQQPTRIRELENLYFTLETQYRELIEGFEKKFEKYYDLKYSSRPIPPPVLQGMVRDDTAIIEYFISRQTLYAFVLTRQTLLLRTSPVNADFNEWVQGYRDAIKKIEEKNFLNLSRKLYRILIEPIEPSIRHLAKWVVIPHGSLYYVPFETLLASGDTTTPYSQLEFLIKRHAFSYHYSVNLWLRSFQSDPSASEKNLIGFAPVFKDARSQEYISFDSNPGQKPPASDPRSITVEGQPFPELPSSEAELKAIIGLFHSRNLKTQGLFYQQATEEQLKSPEMKRFRFIHIATHSLQNQGNPKLSGLILSQPETFPGNEDGILYADETYNLSLDAELLTLSSCESGIGKLVPGEGMMALNRGLFYSGARNVVFSLWKVEDRTTSQLMIEFYRNILQDENLAEALQHAKLTLLKDPFTAFPKYWSGFILLGK